MKATTLEGKQLVKVSDISGSKFETVKMRRTTFEDVNLSESRVHNANLSGIRITAAQIGGAKFKHIGPPPGARGSEKKQQGIVFEDGMLCGSIFRRADLSGVRIVGCNLEGMTIDGVLVTDLLERTQKRKTSRRSLRG